jgi:hypothetical protein
MALKGFSIEIQEVDRCRFPPRGPIHRNGLRLFVEFLDLF